MITLSTHQTILASHTLHLTIAKKFLTQDNTTRHLLTLCQILHRARQLLQSMRVEKVLESLRLDLWVLPVVESIRDMRLPIEKVILVEACLPALVCRVPMGLAKKKHLQTKPRVNVGWILCE